MSEHEDPSNVLAAPSIAVDVRSANLQDVLDAVRERITALEGATAGTAYVVADVDLAAAQADWTPPSATIVRATSPGTPSVDPGAWQADHEYDSGAGRRPTVDDNHEYFASVIGGESGAAEPVWPAAFESVTDNELVWSSYTSIQPSGIDWLAEQSMLNGFTIAADGFVWAATGAFTTGIDPPDWSTAPDQGNTVVDGDGSWINQGTDLGVWAPSTVYVHSLASGGLPMSAYIRGAAGGTHPTDFHVLDSITATTGASGPDEPVFVQGGVIADGELAWTDDGERTSGPTLIDDIAPIAGRHLVLVNLGPVAIDLELNDNTKSVTIAPTQAVDMFYDGAAWYAATGWSSV